MERRNPTLVTIAEASALLRVSGLTLRKWCNEGVLMDYSVAKWRKLISLEDVRELAKIREGRQRYNMNRNQLGRYCDGTQTKEA